VTAILKEWCVWAVSIKDCREQVETVSRLLWEE